MTMLARQVCLNHPSREAAARCVECTRYFCRECIVDYEGRLLCAGCLAKLTQAPATRERRWPATLRLASQGLAGFLFAWLLFYGIGTFLLQLPSTFHEDSFWNDSWNRLKEAAGE